MNIDPFTVTPGVCEQCGFRGLVAARPNAPGAANYEESQQLAEKAHLNVIKACLTCIATPAGCKSDNQLHERLAEEEYRI